MSIPRSSTRRTILEFVRRGRAVTRGDLTAVTGLSRSVVAQTVAELVAEGLVTEHDADRPSGRGRPSTHLRPGRRPGWVAGIDLGHRHVSVILGDLHYTVLRERRTELDVDADARAALGAARALLDASLARHQVARHALVAVALSVPFPVVGRAQDITPLGETPGWVRVRAREALGLDAGTALQVENDANAGAWGELVQEPDPWGRSLLYVRAGEGLGAALVVDGELLRGGHGTAGEVGHVRVPGCTLTCRCGRVGCLDALVTEAAEPGADPCAVVDAGRALGTTLAQLVAFADPGDVVLGGTLGTSSPAFVRATTAAFEEHAAPARHASVRPAQLGQRAELWGAFDLATQDAWAGPVARPGRLALVR